MGASASQDRGFWDADHRVGGYGGGPYDPAAPPAAYYEHQHPGYGSFTNLPPATAAAPGHSSSYDDEAGPSYSAAYQHYANQGFVSPDGYQHGGRWHTGLCDCLADIPTCLRGCFCPCILFGRNVEVLDRGQTACVAASLVWCLLQQLALSGCIYSCWYRRRLRSRFDLPEEPCADCCVHCMCWPCAFCQEAREIHHRSKYEPCMAPPERQTLQRTCSY